MAADRKPEDSGVISFKHEKNESQPRMQYPVKISFENKG